MSCPSARTVRELNLGGREESKVDRGRDGRECAEFN